jgi:toxin ParE1/3/4
MTLPVRLLPRARADLAGIWRYSATRWDAAQADSYIDQVSGHIGLLAVYPLMGRPVPEIREGYRQFPSGSHVLYYRVTDGGIEIVRIHHHKMDAERHL